MPERRVSHLFSSTTARALLVVFPMVGMLPFSVQAQIESELEDKADVARLDAIVVTSQKREESLQDVPISVTAYTGDIVESAGAADILSLNGLAPNVVFQTFGLIPNTPYIAIRGIAQGDPDPNADPKISTVIDGVYIPFVAGTMLDLYDVERVEVLKGPQGTLFGKNNIGGTINVITKRPTDDFGGNVRLTVGENGLLQARARLNTGLFADDKLAAKIAVNFRQYDGFSTNIITGSDLNTQEVSAARGALRFTPTEDIESTLIVDWLDEEVIGPAGQTVDNGDPRFLLIPEQARNDIRVAAYPFDPFATTDTQGLAWETNWSLQNGGTVTSVVGYRELAYETRGDFDGFTVPVPGLDVGREFDSESFSAELRYSSPVSDVFDYVAGVFYEDSTFEQNNTVGIAPPVLSLSLLEQDSVSYAVFAQGNWYFAPNWTLTAGGRYTADEKDYFIDADLFIGGQFVPPSSFEGAFNDTWSNFNPRIALQYEPTDNLLYYASISTGYKGGGYNSRGTIAENVGPFDEETVISYEGGLKSDLADGRLRLNAAVFFNQYEDVQGGGTRQGAARAETVTTNIGDIETSGAELELQWRANQNLTLSLNAAILDAKYKEFCADVDGVFTDGSPEPNQCADAVEVSLGGVPSGLFSVPTDNTDFDVANSPEASASFIVDYFQPTQFGDLSANLDLRYTSEYNSFGGRQIDALIRDDVVLVNGNIALTSLNGGWRVMLFGRNLTDEEVISGSTIAGANPPIQFFQPPREFGLEVSLDF